MICSSTHYSSLCPELYAPLKQGFYTGGGGGGGHSHDDDDEHIQGGFSPIQSVASHASRSASAFPAEIASFPPVCPNTCTSCV